MKGRFLTFGLFAAVFAFVTLALLPDAALPAPITGAPGDLGWLRHAIEASPALLAMRTQLADLTGQAERKLGEMVDGLGPDAVRAIEKDHADLVERADAVRAQITAEEARIAAAPADDGAMLRAERARSAGILDIATRAGMTPEASRAAVASGVTVEAFRAQAFDTLVGRQTPASHIRVEQDETETRRAAMQEALTIRLAPASATPAVPSEAARGFMSHSLIDLAAERLGERRVPGSFGAREDMLRRAFHTTSDFPILFENVLNQSLAARYALAQPTFRMIARQRTYNDFRPHNSVRAGDFPDLQPVNPEGGEIKAGTFGESKESTRVLAYGVQVLLSRAMLVNDNLNAIAQVLNDRGNAVARFEDRTFYAMAFGGGGANGPTLLETTRQLFNTTDATLAAVNAAITVPSLSLGRAALRKRKSKDGVELNLPATILLVGPDKETEAQQILAPVQAQQAGNVNPFSGALSLVVTEKITGNAWHMFAAPSAAPVFEWGLLDGYTAPRMRMEDPFGVQGTKMSLEHDFGCGAIDFRGAYKNIGA